ncbi:MAG: hypothetical protein CVU46_11360 [Chloroflexi bacterium HGW-Chloroflexi-8]|nr:MAG: hypothetical protein CVU46_11360 [Chloroflexi bacterium HGW-Chloroflexi-8]
MKKMLKRILRCGICFLLLLTACTAKPITIKFQNGECTWEGPQKIASEEFSVNMVIEVDRPTTTGYVIVTLEEGKTNQDLEPWKTYDAPDWVQLTYDNGIIDAESGSSSRTYHLLEPMAYQGGPIYFICFQEDTDSSEILKIGNFGPIAVKK